MIPIAPFLLTDVNKNGALDLVYQNNSRLVYREGNGTGNFLDEKTILDYAFIDANSMFSFNSNKDGIGDVMLADINKFVIVELNSAIESAKIITEGYYDDGGGLFSDDVDADGYKDIVTTTRNGSLLIRWGNASHDYTKFTRYKIPFGCIQSVMTDVNKDGINDLIVTRQTYYNGISELRLLQGKGNRQFQNDVAWKAVDYPSKPIITDIDKDGEKDVLVFIRDSNEIIWLDPGNPDYYEYTPSRRITISGKGISGIALADINKDGFTDLLTSNNSSSNFSILTNNTFGNFTETILEKANAILYIQGVAALDYNNDTYPDLLAMTSNGSNEYELQIYLNNKSGSFIYSSSVALKDLYLPQNFDVVDIDADGDKDFIVSNWDYSAANVFIQDKGNYENKGSKVINLGGQFASFYGDINDDGKPDVFSVALIFGNTFQILNNSVTNPDVTKTQINVTEIKSNSVAISFSPTTHNGRLVILKKKDALTTLPADGQFYAANTLFGKGGNLEPDAYVVESGNEDSIIVTGLSPSTAYTISVVDYNTNPPLKNIINYSSNKQEKSFTTKSAPPVIASITDVSSSGMKEISIDLMVSDEDTPLTDLSFSFSSSNSSVVAGENITKQISDNKVFMKFTPKALGQTVITVVVTDPEKNSAEAKVNYSLIVLGLEDEFNTHPHLFPNPFSSTISIRHEQRDQKLMIFDVMGRLLKQFDQIPEEVDLSEQPNGVYIFRTSSGEVMKTMKR